MFIFRWIRKLVVLVLVVAGTLYISNYDYKGKSIGEHIKEAYKSGLISEGIKDIKTWIAEILKFGSKVAKDEVTEQDKAALEGVIKNELKANVTKLKEEAEKVISNGEAEKAKEVKPTTETKGVKK